MNAQQGTLCEGLGRSLMTVYLWGWLATCARYIPKDLRNVTALLGQVQWRGIKAIKRLKIPRIIRIQICKISDSSTASDVLISHPCRGFRARANFFPGNFSSQTHMYENAIRKSTTLYVTQQIDS